MELAQVRKHLDLALKAHGQRISAHITDVVERNRTTGIEDAFAKAFHRVQEQRRCTSRPFHRLRAGTDAQLEPQRPFEKQGGSSRRSMIQASDADSSDAGPDGHCRCWAPQACVVRPGDTL